MRVVIISISLLLISCQNASQSYPHIQTQPQSYWSNRPLNWIAPLDPYGGYGADRPGASDFMELFKQPMAHIDVMQVYGQFLENAPESVILEMLKYLAANNVALAVEMGAVIPDACGQGLEGMTTSTTIARITSRVRALGGTINFIAMDEPFFYGHYRGCQLSTQALVANIKATLSPMVAAFPDVQIGAIEPFYAMPNDWTAEYETFLNTFPMTFVHDDGNVYDAKWQEFVKPVQELLAAHNTPYGFIRKSYFYADSNLKWVTDALEATRYYKTLGLLEPEQNIFQTWDPYPTKLTPQTDTDSFLYFIDQYLKETL